MESKHSVAFGATAILLAVLAQGCRQQSPDPPVPLNTQTQYLLFQSFASGRDRSAPQGTFPLDPQFGSTLPPLLSEFVSQVQSLLAPATISRTPTRKYGFTYGPISINFPDQAIGQIIEIGFDVAIEKEVAVAFHFDISHFWELARNSDGSLLSEGTGANDNREWKDFDGTIADPDHWQPGLLPSMCFECAQVKMMVDRISEGVIAPAIQAGLARLEATGDADLFAGVIVGWEAGSDNVLGYRSLSILGHTSSTSVADLNRAQQQILHDYLLRWAQPIVTSGGVPKEKVYMHTSHSTQWNIDEHFSDAWRTSGSDATFEDFWRARTANGPDSFWVPFNEYAVGGVSIYPNSTQEGMFEAIVTEAAKHGGTWGMCEGTNTTISGAPSDLGWETYLGKIYNHGGTLAVIFGGFLPSGGYQESTESAEAVAAYRKFLGGQTLSLVGP